MPYITKDRREVLETPAIELADQIKTVGDLNYVFSRMIHRFIRNNRLCYDMLNSMIGVLECAKFELYRMVAGPYEDTKIGANGPVSDLDIM